jgi:hypothetical protein
MNVHGRIEVYCGVIIEGTCMQTAAAEGLGGDAKDAKWVALAGGTTPRMNNRVNGGTYSGGGAHEEGSGEVADGSQGLRQVGEDGGPHEAGADGVGGDAAGLQAALELLDVQQIAQLGACVLVEPGGSRCGAGGG